MFLIYQKLENLFLGYDKIYLWEIIILNCFVFIFFFQVLLEIMFGVKVVIIGDVFVFGERSVIIMNYRIRMDWMFLWNCLMRYSYFRVEKICFKVSFKSVFGFGRLFINYFKLFIYFICDVRSLKLQSNLLKFYLNLKTFLFFFISVNLVIRFYFFYWIIIDYFNFVFEIFYVERGNKLFLRKQMWFQRD